MNTSGHPTCGVANFPWPLPVQPEALGMTIAATIGGTPVEITLPVLDHRNSLTPVGVLAHHPIDLGAPMYAGSSWGHLATPDQCEVLRALASFRLPDPPTTAVAAASNPVLQELGRAFDPWFEIVGEWSAVWTDIPPAKLDHQRGSAFQIHTADGQQAGSGAVSSMYHFGRPGMSRSQLEAAFHRASRGERVPPWFKLLVDAKLAMVRLDYRQAVIDASTASEIALAAAISEHLTQRSVDQEFSDNVIVNANGLSGLFKLYTNIAQQPLGVSKNRINNEIARVRNNAVHSGTIPTVAEAQKLLTRARQLVDEVRPLPPS